MSDKLLFLDEVVIETNFFSVHQDWEVPIPGFFIVAPLRESINSIDEFTDDELEEYGRLIREVRKGMREVLGIDCVYFFQNEDTKHGFHLWVFPRYAWMDEFGRKIQSVRLIMDYSKENMLSEDVFEEVRDYVSKMKGFMEDF